MPHFQIIYEGNLRTRVIHLPSQTALNTDAPVDNMGRGQSFSPTDLVAVALATCMITTMSIKARQQGFDVEGMRAEVKKVMTSHPRKVQEIIIRLEFPPQNYTDSQKSMLEYTARHCPVALSLHPDLKQTVEFIYQP
jgi:uncharacterized OsmC-like protein